MPHSFIARRRRGFTLVELLVVIGIIALLLSILLPTLGRAREAANTVKCLANLRSIGQAMMIYTTENKGAIPGSANTSSRHFYNATWTLVLNNSNAIPAGSPIEVFDFITPIARSMGITFSQIDNPSALARFLEQSESEYFKCPSARGILASSFPAGVGPDTEIVSYNTAMGFLLTPGSPAPGKTSYSRVSTGTGWWAQPASYFPNINRIGNPTEKIFAADGAKYTYQGGAPQYNINTATTGQQGKYTDFGAWTTMTGSYDQWSAGFDGRVSSFRHGKRTPRSPAGSMLMNAVFFDGHAATLDDGEATNPKYWLPKGA
ncbi:MAG TPA: prepilin-type N-terminal cleavage/methylation domain-containing protein, partial [Tepidisphaeraceae bacterium]|nr:prepilin-type N-terminal cleavage/methylation domain-containing protein [Tepidisphaeraceae bacterium]